MSASAPSYVKAINTLTSYPVASTFVSVGTGAFLGNIMGNNITGTTHSLLSDLCWKSIHPYIIKPLFMHPHSTLASKVTGLLMSCVSSIIIPSLFHRIILELYKLKMDVQQNPNNPFWHNPQESVNMFFFHTPRESILLSLIPSMMALGAEAAHAWSSKGTGFCEKC